MTAPLFERVGRSWLRREPGGNVWVTSNSDHSPVVFCSGNGPESRYDSACAYCYLGHAHSQEAHDKERLDSTGENYDYCGEVRP
jgi:hypothetical protein